MIRVKLAVLTVLAITIFFAADVRAQGSDGIGAPPAASDAAPPTLVPAPRRDERISLTLSDGTRLVGKPSDLEQLEFKTEYGELKVPITKIEGLRFGDYPFSGEEHACGVHFTNGDVLSARLQLKSLKLETLVGEVDVECQHLRSMVMSPDDKVWAQVGDAWKLVPAGRHYGSAAPQRPPTPVYYSTPAYAPAPLPDSGYSDSYPTPSLPAPIAPPAAVPSFAPAPEASAAPPMVR
jgi:hypothetical protein